MKEALRKIKRKLLSLFGGYVIKRWERAGKPLPPPYEYKQKVIRGYQKKSNLHVLIETGTFLGDMVEAQRKFFKKIYSIELSEVLFTKAQKRFRHRPHIKILEGDSSHVLKSLLTEINEPCIFWLDGHYSAGITAKGDKECPVFEELAAIFGSKKLPHILLIDDARLFGVQNDYPTIAELKMFVNDNAKDATFLVEGDIIRIALAP